ncbi:MAG TPA: hypothetical protein VFF50_14695 [Candidatus Deferrimicrobiaceae bacterium]|jgi:hypothetical protein|nr:hypothetical protein [Candidatus Deferrimicrobiaceae bacterium]
MSRTIDQIRASKLPSNMMQFAARGALSVPPDENLEILVYLARHNKVFGDLARMTLAGWDETASLAAASNPQTARDVLDYLVSPENLRPKLLPALLENPSVAESELVKFAISASPENIAAMLQSARVRKATTILQSLRSNPYVKPNEASTIADLLGGNIGANPDTTAESPGTPAPDSAAAPAAVETAATAEEDPGDVPEEAISAYLTEHAAEIVAEEGKPFQPVGGIMDLLGADYFPVSAVQEIALKPEAAPAAAAITSAAAAKPGVATAAARTGPPIPAKRDNSMQKISRLDVKGRIQLALKGNKEERSLLIRDGTKVVALAVLEAPKLSDGEVEKFALQKNVLEAVLRQIPLKRRFMKDYIVVRNLVSNPRTPLDLGLGLMKHLLTVDLKNISANKEVSETVRKLALKMYKQKLDAANKK